MLLTTADPYQPTSYTLGRKLGSGASGTVYEAISHLDGLDYAIKLSSSDSYDQSMYHEYQAYKRLNQSSMDDDFAAVPRAYYYGIVHMGRNSYTALVMDRLGASVENMLGRKGGALSLSSVLSIGVQAVRALKIIHEGSFVHCDVKPDNMVADRLDSRKVYFVDFGLARPYRSHAHGEHVKLRYGNQQKAVALFASLNWHDSMIASRRDDLESLAYVLVYLYRGKLPWQGMDLRDTWECKRRYPIAKLCRGMTSAVVDFLVHVRGLRFEDRPDYSYLAKLLTRSLNELGYGGDSTAEGRAPSARPKEVSSRRKYHSGRGRRSSRHSRRYSRSHSGRRH